MPVTQTPLTDQQLRDQAAEALMAWAESNNTPGNAPFRRPETVTRNAYSRADAVLALVQPELDRLRAELATARPCECFAATFHAHTCQLAVITWNGTTYNTGHWLIDREGVPWMPHSLADGMTGELLLLCNGDYSNDPSPIGDVLDEWGPLTVGDPVDHSKIPTITRGF